MPLTPQAPEHRFTRCGVALHWDRPAKLSVPPLRALLYVTRSGPSEANQPRVAPVTPARAPRGQHRPMQSGIVKGPALTGRPLHGKGVRRRPTLPHSLPCSTIGAEGLSFRVRNGTGRFPFAMTAVTLSSCQSGSRPSLGNRTVDACNMYVCVKLSAY